MCTNIKYKNRHDIENCVLYTASNYPINTYLQVYEAEQAITTRTHEFKFHFVPADYFLITLWTWEKLCATYTYENDDDED